MYICIYIYICSYICMSTTSLAMKSCPLTLWIRLYMYIWCVRWAMSARYTCVPHTVPLLVFWVLNHSLVASAISLPVAKCTEPVAPLQVQRNAIPQNRHAPLIPADNSFVVLGSRQAVVFDLELVKYIYIFHTHIYVYSKTSLTDQLPISTTSPYRSLHFGYQTITHHDILTP